MGRYNDFTGVGNTCPYIDQVLEAVVSVDCWEDFGNYDSKESLTQSLETIRIANSELRDFGNEWFKASEEFENELNEHKRINEDLEQEIESLKSHNEQLQSNLDNVVQ